MNFLPLQVPIECGITEVVPDLLFFNNFNPHAMVRFLLLYFIYLSSLTSVYSQGGGCNGSPMYGTRVLVTGEKQKLLTYSIKHSFTLYPGTNFTPSIYTVSFNHAWVKEPFTGCMHAKVNPASQPPTFKKFGKDTIITDIPYNNFAFVDTVIHWVENSGGILLDTAFADSCYSRSRASTCIVIDSVKTNSVSGVLQSYGFSQAINPTLNTNAYAFSWSGVSVEDGQPLKKGDIGWVPGTSTGLKGKSRNIRQKAGTNDPIVFNVHDFNTGLDTSGTLLSIVMRQQLEEDTLDRTNYWLNDTVHIESDSILFKIHYPSGFTKQQGLLYLLVENGFVVQAQKTGVFLPVQLPFPGTPVPFSFPLPNDINFRYNLDTTGLFGNDSILVKLFMYGNNENHEILTYDTTALVPTPQRPSCPGGTDGSMDLFVNYGFPPYFFSWSNGATTQNLLNVPAGIYSVIVIDSMGTTAMVTDTVEDPPLLVAGGIVTPVTCKGAHNGTITVTPAGGTPGYTYLWNNGSTNQSRTGLYPNTYTVTVTDSKGCTAMTSFTVVQSPSALLVSTSKTNVKCNGKCSGRAKATPSGGTPPYSYLWNTGAVTSLIDHLCAGTYICTVTDSYSCSKVKTYVITQPSALALSASPTGNPGEAAALATGGTPPYTFKWFTVPVQTTPIATGLTGGSVYKVKVTDFNACTKTIFFTMPFTRSEDPSPDQEKLVLYPNPAFDFIYMEYSGNTTGSMQVELTDLTGRMVFRKMMDPDHLVISVAGFEQGLYLVKIHTREGILTRKIVLQK